MLFRSGLARKAWASDMTRILDWDWRSPGYFWKQFISGMAITVVMTGLDQNNMQKSLSCPNAGQARKNLYAFALVQVPVNLCFLVLGWLLHAHAAAQRIALPAATDHVFPTIALHHLGTFAAVVFVVGLTAATFNSADSVLTTLTTSFCFDFLGLDRRTDLDDVGKARVRRRVHVGFAFVVLWVKIGRAHV